jgi:hypothetical protein
VETQARIQDAEGNKFHFLRDAVQAHSQWKDPSVA